jgi:hypothetical protein
MLTALIADFADVQLHTADPGGAGTTSVSSVTTREAETWGSPSAGSVSASGTPTWSSWAGTNGEEVTDISGWSAPTSGTFGDSIQLGSGVTLFTGDTLELTAVTISIPTAS